MIPAIYRWLSAQLDGLTGEDALVGVAVIAILSVIGGYALFELGSFAVKAWRKSRAPKFWPIPFVERSINHRDPWPWLATVAIVALFLGIWTECGR